MDGYEAKTGGEVLAIPHNGNLSNGIMFWPETFEGKPMDACLHAGTGGIHQPLIEVTQIKGDSETQPLGCRRTMNLPISSAGITISEMIPRR